MLLASIVLGRAVAVAAPATVGLNHVLLNPSPDKGDRFGGTLAAMGTRLLVGAPNDDAAGVTDAGAAYVVDPATETTLLALANPTPGQDDGFGSALTAVGNLVVVGAPRDSSDGGAFHAGAAYVFDGTTGALVRTLRAPVAAAGARFGAALATLGANVVVGAPRDDAEAADSAGVVYLFDAASGALLRTFANPTSSRGDRFGFAIAPIGPDLVVGAPADDVGASNGGAAYRFSAATGEALGAYQQPSPLANDRFGSAIAVAAGRVLIAAPRRNSSVLNAGHVWAFDAATGAVLATFAKASPARGEQFGSAVIGFGPNLVVGVPFESTRASDAGLAYVLDGTTGEVTATLQNPTAVKNERFGSALACLGTSVAVGAPDEGPGRVFVYTVLDGGGGCRPPAPLPNGLCVSDADCADDDACTIDTCAPDHQCVATPAAAFAGIVCRLVTLEGLLGAGQTSFTKPRLRKRLVQLVVAARARTEASSTAKVRRARRGLKRVSNLLGIFIRLTTRGDRRDHVEDALAARLLELAREARSRVAPLRATLRPQR